MYYIKLKKIYSNLRNFLGFIRTERGFKKDIKIIVNNFIYALDIIKTSDGPKPQASALIHSIPSF
jgi:hypothetical protein